MHVYVLIIRHTQVLTLLLYVCRINKLPLREDTVVIDAEPPVTPVFSLFPCSFFSGGGAVSRS